MRSPSSIDLRERGAGALPNGAFFYRAAAQIGVSVSCARRWPARFAKKGHVTSNS